LLFTGVTLGLVLALTELALRIADPDIERLFASEFFELDLNGRWHEKDPQLFWKLRPNVRTRTHEQPKNFGWRTNSQGFRADREFSRTKPSGLIRVVCLGDSVPFGWGVEREQAFPHLLEQQLASDGKSYEVINAGVPGYSSYQGRQYLPQLLAYKPDVLVVYLGINDTNQASRTDRQRAARGLQQSRAPLVTYRIGRAILRRHFAKLPVYRCWFEEYVENIAAITEACNRQGVMLVVVHPVYWTRKSGLRLILPKPRNSLSLDQQRAELDRLGERHVWVHLTDVLSSYPGDPRELYLDEGPDLSCHWTVQGHQLVAQELTKVIRVALGSN